LLFKTAKREKEKTATGGGKKATRPLETKKQGDSSRSLRKQNNLF